MKIALPLLLLITVYSCHSKGDTPTPTPPAKPTVTFNSAVAYSPYTSGVPVTATAFNITVKVNVENQIDSVVLIDETNAEYFLPLVVPVSKDYQILDPKHPYPSDDIYHLKVYVNDKSTFVTPSFAGK